MSRFAVQVLVTPRPGLLDPQGKAIHRALASLGYGQVGDVRVGKAVHLTVEADSARAAEEAVEEMCRKLLANPVTEDFRVRATEDGAAPGGRDGSGDSGGRANAEAPAAADDPAGAAGDPAGAAR